MTPLNPYSARPHNEDTVIDLLTGGQPWPVSPADRHEAIRRLFARGYDNGAIAVRLRCSTTTVRRAVRAVTAARVLELRGSP